MLSAGLFVQAWWASFKSENEIFMGLMDHRETKVACFFFNMHNDASLSAAEDDYDKNYSLQAGAKNS